MDIYVDIDERDNLEEKMGLCNQYLACAGYSIQVEHDLLYMGLFLVGSTCKNMKKDGVPAVFLCKRSFQCVFLNPAIKSRRQRAGRLISVIYVLFWG